MIVMKPVAILWHKHPKQTSHNLQVFTDVALLRGIIYQRNFDNRKLPLVAMGTKILT